MYDEHVANSSHLNDIADKLKVRAIDAFFNTNLVIPEFRRVHRCKDGFVRGSSVGCIGCKGARVNIMVDKQNAQDIYYYLTQPF